MYPYKNSYFIARFNNAISEVKWYLKSCETETDVFSSAQINRLRSTLSELSFMDMKEDENERIYFQRVRDGQFLFRIDEIRVELLANYLPPLLKRQAEKQRKKDGL